MKIDLTNADPTSAFGWPEHVWHDCAKHGHVNQTASAHCLACDGGLGGCTVCGAWEGDIVDSKRCIGADPSTHAGMELALRYHYEVAPVLRPAKHADLFVGRFVAVWDFGAWQYAGKVIAVIGPTYRVDLGQGDPDDPQREGPLKVGLEHEPSVPALGVYDPYSAVKEDK